MAFHLKLTQMGGTIIVEQSIVKFVQKETAGLMAKALVDIGFVGCTEHYPETVSLTTVKTDSLICILLKILTGLILNPVWLAFLA